MPGGKGEKVIVVTNTSATGPGSFFEALNTQGPRIIVFRTSGVITLTQPAMLQANSVLCVNPNPLSGQARITLASGRVSAAAKAFIYTVTGQRLAEAKRSSIGEWIWLTAGFAPGVYVVEVVDGKSRRGARTVVMER
jgi:hypothetical protein